PSITFADIADTQVALLRSLGIERLHAAVGGSTGGFLALSLATRYPDFVGKVAPLASGVKATALQTIQNFEQITAVQNDPAFQGGDYYPGPGPERGLMLARMIGHKTFVSLAAMEERARGEVIRREGPGTYQISNTLESYMWHQAEKFVQRFDANSYLRIMEAWQGFDLAADAGLDDVSEVFVPCKHQEYLVFSIDSDVCFYPDEQADLTWNLKLADVPHRRITVHSEKGHDSFLVDPDLFAPHLRDFLG
ncbi:MAG: alpha/beta fold hydrolase, partial [Acidimicrobiia bacterium]|nr:alpha/beta fold hydrolase [Acidimicrobiia bacterium]